MGTDHLYSGPEIYCGPMDDTTVAFVAAYGSDKGNIYTDKVKAGALAVNYNVPVLSENRTVGQALAMLGDCGALLDTLGAE